MRELAVAVPASMQLAVPDTLQPGRCCSLASVLLLVTVAVSSSPMKRCCTVHTNSIMFYSVLMIFSTQLWLLLQGGFLPEMTRREAALILGLRESATEERIKDAHRRIMVANHPDSGGSSYIAAKVRMGCARHSHRRDMLPYISAIAGAALHSFQRQFNDARALNACLHIWEFISLVSTLHCAVPAAGESRS